MTFRTRLLLIFTATVVASVVLVEWLVLDRTRRAFESIESQRAAARITEFRREFDRRREEIARSVLGIAESEAAVNLAIAPDPARSYGEAGALAAAHSLDLLEFVAGDGSIVSSAEWPERFGYKEDWLTTAADWRSLGAFLRREELPNGVALGLVAVSTVAAADRRLYVAGGQLLDRRFLASLDMPAGMRVLMYRNLDPPYSPAELLGAHGSDAERLRPLIEQVRKQGREVTASIGGGDEAEIIHAVPLEGHERQLLAVLLIGSSRRDLVHLESSLRRIGIFLAGAGIAIGFAMSWWATARVTRPVRRLAESAGKVAAGNWAATVEESSGGEIGQLARAFNRMTHELVAQRERLLQAERVASWRELARRLAHELKNPLFPLQITVENMKRARESCPGQFDEVFREGIETILAEISNLKQIVARFSDFARMPAPEMHSLDVNRLTREVLKLFEPQFDQAGIATRTELDSRVRPIQADPEQIGRALRNLVANAIDAMPRGGVLTVRTEPIGEGVRIEVSDTGQGLTPEECERLFTPYYTTKTHGTGLGLAIVQSVVSDHKGRIAVESTPGKGTTFRIDLG